MFSNSSTPKDPGHSSNSLEVSGYHSHQNQFDLILIFFFFFLLHGVFAAAQRLLWLRQAGAPLLLRSTALEPSRGLSSGCVQDSCLEACGIFLGQGLNLRPPHWPVDFYPLNQKGNPKLMLKSHLNPRRSEKVNL